MPWTKDFKSTAFETKGSKGHLSIESKWVKVSSKVPWQSAAKTPEMVTISMQWHSTTWAKRCLGFAHGEGNVKGRPAQGGSGNPRVWAGAGGSMWSGEAWSWQSWWNMIVDDNCRWGITGWRWWAPKTTLADTGDGTHKDLTRADGQLRWTTVEVYLSPLKSQRATACYMLQRSAYLGSEIRNIHISSYLFISVYICSYLFIFLASWVSAQLSSVLQDSHSPP